MSKLSMCAALCAVPLYPNTNKGTVSRDSISLCLWANILYLFPKNALRSLTKICTNGTGPFCLNLFSYILSELGVCAPCRTTATTAQKIQKLVLLADLAVPRPIRANISYSKKKVACEGGLAVNGCILVITFSHFSHFSSHFTRRKVVAQTWCVYIV